MGVDYYVCPNCHETYPDCGPTETCEGCETTYCGHCLPGIKGDENAQQTCRRCRRELLAISTFQVVMPDGKIWVKRRGKNATKQSWSTVQGLRAGVRSANPGSGPPEGSRILAVTVWINLETEDGSLEEVSFLELDVKKRKR